MPRITISALPLTGDLVMPAIMQAARACPDLRFTYRPSLERVVLDDADLIALRAGTSPPDGGMVGHWLGWLGVGLVATGAYLEQRGRAETPADLARHIFAGHEPRAVLPPWFRWLARHVAEPDIGFFTDDEAAMRRAIRSGCYAGFLPFSSLIWSPELVEIYPPQEDWRAPLWLVHAETASPGCREVADVMADIMSRALEG